jgi:prophage tail gpP-like protein
MAIKQDTYYRDNTLEGERFIDYYKDKAKPTQGEFYTVVSGDDFVKISIGAYGSTADTWNIIRANAQLTKGRKKDTWGAPLLYPGDRVFIPGIAKALKPEPDTIESSGDEIIIRLNGKIYHGWTTTTIFRSMDSIADGFTFQAPYNPDDPESSELDPYTYYPADLFIGGELYISGRCEKWDPNVGEDSTIMSIECRSRSGVIIDCPSQDSALNSKNQTLPQITDRMIKPFGLSATFPDDYTGSIISKSKRGISDKIYSYLQELAKSAGLIINSAIDGGLKYERANINGESIISLVQGEQPLKGVTATYDGTARFSHYESISQSNGKAGNRNLELDKSIPVFRPTIFDSKDTNQGNIKNAAKWEKSRALARSAKVSVTIATWRDSKGRLFFENNIITLIAKNACIFSETRFLIEKVSLQKESGGNIATLDLVTPESYSLEFPNRFWWSRIK